MQEIKIKRPLAMHLMALAQQSPDQEVCGLIACVDNVLSTCYPISNVSPTPSTHFLMDAEEQAHALSLMKDKQETVFAVYHSHPSSPPTPSQTDLDELGYENALYLIISLNTKGVLEMAAYQLNHGLVEAVELTI